MFIGLYLLRFSGDYVRVLWEQVSFCVHWKSKNKINFSSSGGCPPGVPVVDCVADPCLGRVCPGYPDAVCRPNYCGGCNAFFYDANGNPISGCSGMRVFLLFVSLFVCFVFYLTSIHLEKKNWKFEKNNTKCLFGFCFNKASFLEMNDLFLELRWGLLIIVSISWVQQNLV